MALNFATKDLVRWAWFMIVVETVYVITEIAFNSAILNASAGLVWSRESITNLEHIGRTLSGFGFGLMVFGFLGVKRTNFKYRMKVLAITLAVTVPTMYFGQKLLIDEIVIKRASSELLEKAERSMIIKRAYQSGAYSISSVGFEGKNVANPEEMSLLSMMGLLILNSPEWDGRVDQDGRTILHNTYTTLNKAAAEKAWAAYSTADAEIDNAWAEYSQASKEFKKARDSKLSSVGVRDAWNDVIAESRTAFNEYQSSKKQYRDSIINEAKRKGFAEQLEAKFDRMSICRTSQRCVDMRYKAIREMIRKGTGIDKHISYWCDANGCPAPRATLYNKLVSQKVSQGDFKKRTGLSYNINDIDTFMRQPVVYKELRLVLEKEYGMRNLDSFNGTFSSFKASYKSMVLAKAAKEWYQSSDKAYGLPPNLSRAEFFKTDLVQGSLKAIFGLSLDDKYSVKLGLSKEKFIREFTTTAVDAKVNGELKRLSLGVQSNDETKAQYQDALRGLIVPPIALFLSLFFSMFTLIRIPLRVLAISFYHKPDQWKIKLRKTLMLMDFIFVLAFPLLKSENKLAKKEVIEEVFEYFGNDISLGQGWAMKWFMNAEPILYPIGNAILNVTGLNNIDHPTYEDDFGSRNVNENNFTLEVKPHQPAFSNLTATQIREAQRILNKLGYHVGSADGIAGNKTISGANDFATYLGFYSTDVGANPYGQSGAEYLDGNGFTSSHYTLTLMAR
ncbi:peptidoglycan-binding domain-containing protein [Vibrio harveyi]|uniref:peptidoglycan-binding domain-containing protein n=1 Tax=Vibrio harveyi TaxID=669 RepID=UPI003CF25A40